MPVTQLAIVATLSVEGKMYVKIFAGILESSIASDTKLRRFFMDLLLIADQDGNVVATRDAIAKRLGTTRDEVDWGIEKLQQPDPDSGNPENDGRRLEPMEGRGYGWTILNYGFYRDIKTASELRAANARRQAEFKARKRAAEVAGNGRVTLPNKSNPSEAYADTDSSTSQKKEQKKEHARKRASLSPLPEPFVVSDRVKAWAQQHDFGKLDQHLEHFVSTAQARAYVYADWDAAFMNAIRKDWAGVRAAVQSQTVKPQLGKTAQAMHTLEGMKHANSGFDLEPNAAPSVPRIGGPAGS